MPLGVCRLTKRILFLVLGLSAGIGLVSCGGYGSSYGSKKAPSGINTRVLASQSVTSAGDFGGLSLINGIYDTIVRPTGMTAGSEPGLMVLSPGRGILAVFDQSSNSVFGEDTATETTIGHVQLPGRTISIAVPTASPLAYAAVPNATVSGYSFLGAVDELNLAGALTTTMAVPNAETVVANANGSQLLVFSNDSNAVTVLSPNLAVPPVDLSCLSNQANAVCTVIPGFDRPVYAVINGTTAYIFNCGAECGGKQASIQTLDLGSLTAGTPVPVNGAVFGMMVGTKLYVAGRGTATGQLCASLTLAAKTAATYCGTLDIIDLNTMTDPYFNKPAIEIAIPDGYQQRMDISPNGQLFIGSRNCTNVGNGNIIGNVTSPDGEVRGCLAILNTTNNNTVTFPPENGDVVGFQSLIRRTVEYVAQGGFLYVYDTTTDRLLITDFIPAGTIPVVGYVGDVKALDVF